MTDPRDDAPLSAGRDAEVTEEQHLDDRHATGEHYTGDGDAIAADDPLAILLGGDPEVAATDDFETDTGRGVNNI